MKDNIKEFFNEIDNSEKICVIGHVAPDGDCIGSVMALYEFLSVEYNKDVYFGFDGKIPYNFRSYIDESLILTDFEDKKFDLLIVLDCADEERLGRYKSLISNSKKIICIDHHKTNTEFADINIVDPTISSTGELLFHILNYENKKTSLKMAEYIYTAIITDTGNFAYSSTTATTHRVAAELIDIGVDVANIDNLIFNSKPISTVKAYIDCISNINFYYDNKLGIAKISDEIIKRNNANINDIEGIVEFIREISEVEISCVLKEYNQELTKVSLRSKNDIDVSEVSVKFNGGGHAKAAGFQINANLEEAEAIVVKELEKYICI
jgi:phosphoesterase RecJ-like protein